MAKCSMSRSQNLYLYRRYMGRWRQGGSGRPTQNGVVVQVAGRPGGQVQHQQGEWHCQVAGRCPEWQETGPIPWQVVAGAVSQWQVVNAGRVAGGGGGSGGWQEVAVAAAGRNVIPTQVMNRQARNPLHGNGGGGRRWWWGRCSVSETLWWW